MLKIAFFQFIPIYNNLEENFRFIEALLNNNNKQISDADLVVFPEYCFGGSLSLGDLPVYKKQLKLFDLEDNMMKLSLKYPSTTFIFGSAVIPREGMENVALVFSNGSKLAEYSKKALIYNENYICKSNNKYPVFKIGEVRVGIAICWDLILPEVFRKYTGKVDLVVVPSFWGIGGNPLQSDYRFSLEKRYYKELCVTRSYENSFNLLFVNAVGKYESPHYKDRMMGGSLLVTPPLGINYFTNSKNKQALHFIELDMEPLKKYRELYATDKDYEYYKSKNIF